MARASALSEPALGDGIMAATNRAALGEESMLEGCSWEVLS